MTRDNSPFDAAATAETKLSEPAEANLLEWLEGFAERLKGRTNAVADEHVYEEDERDMATRRISKKDAKQPSLPTESYEHEILPRYKDAVAIAWAAFQESSHQNDQNSVKPGSRSKLDRFNLQRGLHQRGISQILPHVFGSEEFTRDVHCGLADLRHLHHDPEYYADVEQGREGLAAEPIDMGNLSEVEISGTESDGYDSQEGVEPAVSAALDFKAMLEAALRTPYDGGTSNEALFGQFADNKFSLPNATSDNMNTSPRTISTMVDIIGRTMSTMDESKEELRDTISHQSNGHDKSTRSLLATEPSAALGDPIPTSTLEERLKKPLNQAMLNQEFKQHIDSNSGDRHGTVDLGHVPIHIPGGFLNNEVHDTGFVSREDATLRNSDTGPSIPEGLFQEQVFLEPIGNPAIKSQSLSSFGSSQNSPRPLPSPVDDIVRRSSSQDSDSVLINSDQNGSGKSQSEYSLMIKHASRHSASSSISSGSNVIAGSKQAGQLPIRGGLFDDDDEDENAGDLFGVPAPRVDSQPVLRSWASQSSKGLFDDIVTERDGTISFSNDETGTSQEIQQNIDFSSSITSQYESQSGLGVLDSLRQRSGSASVETSSDSVHVDLEMSSDPKGSGFNNENDIKEEAMQLPIESSEAAAVRSFTIESDDDSWSGSESGFDVLIRGKNVIEQKIHEDAAIKVSGNDDGGADEYQSRTAEGIRGLIPEAPADSRHLAQSVSSKEKTSPAAIHGEGEITVSSSQTAPEVLSTTSRSFSGTEMLPEEVSVKLTEDPLTRSKIVESPDTEASHLSDSANSSGDVQERGVGQRRPVKNLFSSTSSHFENLGESKSQPLSPVNQTRPSLAKNSGDDLASEDWSKISSRNLPVRVDEPGRSTRIISPLFDEDDPEEDLFDTGSSQHQGALFPRPGQLGSVLSSDTSFPKDPQQSLVTQNVHTQQPPASNSSSDVLFSSHSSSVGERDVDLSSAKSGSKLSSLLFGDDDEDDEDALFGPLVGRTSRGLNSGKA